VQCSVFSAVCIVHFLCFNKLELLLAVLLPELLLMVANLCLPESKES